MADIKPTQTSTNLTFRTNAIANVSMKVQSIGSGGSGQIIEDSSLLCRYKGTVATTDNLPSSATLGDIYNVATNGTNYVWTGNSWDAMYEKEYTVATNYDIEEMF